MCSIKNKSRILVHVAVQLLALGSTCVFAQVSADVDPNVRHEEALTLYRQHNSASALSILAGLYYKYPGDSPILYDYLAIASWSGNHNLALDLAKKIDLEVAPAYVLEAIAASHRQQKSLDSAITAYDVSIRRFPERVEPRLGRINVLIDMQRYLDAESALSPLQDKYSNRADVLDTAFRMVNHDPLRSLLKVQKSLKNDPANASLLRIRFYALKKLGAHHLAAQLIPKNLLSAAEEVELIRDKLAFKLRWARVSADNQAQLSRWREMDAVILNMQQFCNIDEEVGIASEAVKGGCGDLVVALSDRLRMKESIVLYEKMLGKQWAIPHYVQFSVAAAYLYERQPEKARDLFAVLLNEHPENINGQLGYIFALLESEQYDAALRRSEQLTADTNEWINPKLLDIRQPNPAYARVQLSDALVSVYTDRLATGTDKLESLVKRAPYNAEFRSFLASAYGYRGWYRRAESEFELLYISDSKDVSSMLGMFENRMAVSDYKGAVRPLKVAEAMMPQEQSVKKAQREWATYKLHELQLDAKQGQSASGGLAPFGNRESLIEARLFSVPYDYNWRVFAHTQLATTTFPDMSVSRTALGGGAEYRARDFSATGEMTNLGHLGTGLTVNGEYHFNDQWSVVGMGESKSLSAPIRAYADKVNASNVMLGGAYRWHESRTLNIATNQMNFSDGNQRNAVDVSWMERLLTGPIYKLDATVEYYASRNASQSPLINYFNPLSDHYTGLSMRNEWTQLHRYEKSLKHVLTIGVGSYAQQNFSSGQVMNIAYEQIYRPDERLELHYGLGRTQHPYDGVRVTEDYLNFTANWMF